MPACPSCHHDNSTTARYCSQCGAALETDPPNPYAEEPGNAPPPTDDADSGDPLDGELLALLREGKKIAAIKRLREQTGWDLKESKNYVESLALRHGVEVPRGSGCAGVLLLGLTGLAIAIAALVQSL